MAARVRYARTSDGVRIGYLYLGHGPPIVFASSAFGDAHFYRFLHPHTRRMTDGLVELGWSVIRYDLRGMGSSDRTFTDMSEAALVRDLEAVIEKLGLQYFVLAGLHGGAATAIRYAASNPGRVTQLVLLNPFRLGAVTFSEDPVGKALASVTGMAADDFSFFSLIVGNLMTRFTNPDHARDLALIFQKSTSPQTLIAYQTVLKQVDLTSLLPKLEMPTLVVHDTGFPFGSFAEREKLATAIPRARLVVIPADGGAEIAAIDSFLRSSGQSVGEDVPPTQVMNPDGQLTPRESEVLRLIARGLTNREISGLLVLSERTVSRHITNLYGKLALRSRAEATAYAIRQGLA